MNIQTTIDNIVDNQLGNQLGPQLGYHCVTTLRKELVEAAQKYRDEGVAEVGLACARAQMGEPKRENPKVVIIDSVDALYKYMIRDAEHSAHVKSAMERELRTRKLLDELDATCKELKEANRLAKPITQTQQEWIDTTEFVMGSKFPGGGYDDAWTWIAENKIDKWW